MREAKKSSVTDITNEVVAMEVFPPGYPIMMHYWISIWGDSEFSVRLPSLIFGVASIVMLFLIGANLFEIYTGLLAAFFMSTGMLQILFSQEARLYSLFGFLTLFSTYALIKYVKKDKLRDKHRQVWSATYIVVTVAAFYVNYLTIFLVIFQMLTLLYLNVHHAKRMILPLCIVFVLCIPLINIMTRQFTVHHARWTGLLITYGIPQSISKIGLLLFALPMVSITLLGALVIIKKKELKHLKIDKREKMLIGIVFLVSAVIYIIFLDVITRSFVLVRHSYFFVPTIYIAMAKYIESCFKNKRVQAIFIMLIIIFNIMAVSYYYQKTSKPDWRSATSFISVIDEDPSVIFLRSGSNSEIFKYYFKENFKEIVISMESVEKNERKAVLDALSNEKDFWLVISKDKDAREKIRGIIEEKYVQTTSNRFIGVEVGYYVQKNHQ